MQGAQLPGIALQKVQDSIQGLSMIGTICYNVFFESLHHFGVEINP
jgi:hypothetical protein